MPDDLFASTETTEAPKPNSGGLRPLAARMRPRALDELHAQGQTVVLVTHEPDIAAHAHRVLRVMDGRIVGDDANPARRAPTVH